jgi:hypothetical protein
LLEALAGQPTFFRDFAEPFTRLRSCFHELFTHASGRGAQALSDFA